MTALPNKYHAKAAYICAACEATIRPEALACHVCGAVELIRFDSRAECKRYYELRALERIGDISGLQRQPKLVIYVHFNPISGLGNVGHHVKVGIYRADFCYMKRGEEIIEDVKGVDTALSRFKRKCVEAQYGIKIRIIKA